ncbi:uncharacterized protein F5147DRAFT_526242, partial [Suillus discolor]
IHQFLSPHPNIVTLHRILETDTFLLLVLGVWQYSPTHFSLPLSALLSHTRLRLIASMFAQMCDAVTACHDQHAARH